MATSINYYRHVYLPKSVISKETVEEKIWVAFIERNRKKKCCREYFCDEQNWVVWNCCWNYQYPWSVFSLIHCCLLEMKNLFQFCFADMRSVVIVYVPVIVAVAVFCRPVDFNDLHGTDASNWSHWLRYFIIPNTKSIYFVCFFFHCCLRYCCCSVIVTWTWESCPKLEIDDSVCLCSILRFGKKKM